MLLDPGVGGSSPFIGAGWNVLQYKQRDIVAQDRSKIVSGLKNQLKISTGKQSTDGEKVYHGALKDVYERNGKRSTRYTLFTNIDLTHRQKQELKKTILEGYDQPEAVTVVVYGAADLAAFLNDLPHLRSAYFVPSQFSTWDEAWKSHAEENPIGGSVPLIGRGTQLTTLASYLQESSIRAMILTGPTGIGKSRLALEATRANQVETIIALDPASMTVNDLLALASPGTETIVIIDDPDPKKAEDFVRHTLSHHELKLVITLSTSEHVLMPNFGRDERVKQIPLEILTDQQARELLRAAHANFDFGIESWIIAQANGNPEILLVAASIPDLRKSTNSFIDDVATSLENKIRREQGDRVVEILRLASLLKRVNVLGPLYEELAALSSLFDDTIKPNDVLNELPSLQRSGLIRLNGSYVEVIPTLLANHFAETALKGRYSLIQDLFVTLNRPARFRFIERLREIKSVEVAHFWDELFSSTGLFADFQAALMNIQLLYAISSAVPTHVVSLLENGLGALQIEERAAIPGEARRYLVSIVYDLLFRENTSKSALRCILLLAEPEVGLGITSSLETFYDCFHPFHPQCPLSLDDRLDILRSTLSPASSPHIRKIGLQAIVHGLAGGLSFTLREGNGPEPLSTPPDMKWADIWNYWNSLFDMLFDIVRSDDSELAELAQEALPDVLIRFTLFGHIGRGLNRFYQVAQWCMAKQISLSVSRLSQAIIHIQNVINQRQAQSAEVEEIIQNAKQVISDILSLLEGDDFSMRLMRWVGIWVSNDHDQHMEKVRALVREVIDQPHLLTEPLLEWLISEEAKQGLPFFRMLGEQDTDRFWLAKIEELGSLMKGAGAFSSYFYGLSTWDRPFVNQRLSQLALEGRITGRAIVWATSDLPADSASVERVVKLLEEGRVERVDVELRLLRYSPWLNTLSVKDYERLLKVSAGDDLEHAIVVVSSLITWLYTHEEMNRALAEFAWQCLEQVSPNSLEDAHRCDTLASKLVEVDVERGFTLYEKKLRQLRFSTHWNPLSSYTGQLFCSALYKAEQKRTLWIPLSLALEDRYVRPVITSSLREWLDEERDAHILIEFAGNGVERAYVVCECLTAGKSGFWPIALELVRRYPSDVMVRDLLLSPILRPDSPPSVMAGLPSIALQSRLEDVKHLLAEMSLSPTERTWLREVERRLQAEIEAFGRFQSDIEANRGSYIEDDPSASERLWMLRKILLDGNLSALKGALSKKELLSLLPHLQLSETERTQYEEQIKQWE